MILTHFLHETQTWPLQDVNAWRRLTGPKQSTAVHMRKCRVSCERIWCSDENLNNSTVVTDQREKRLLLSYSTFFLNCVDFTLSLKQDSSSLPQTSVQRSHYLPPERCFSVASAATGHLFLSLFFSEALPCCNII